VVTIEWYKIAGIVIGLVVLYVIGYFLFKDNTNKQYKKARSFHKEAELCYESGEFDLAEEYYNKAEELRKIGQEQV
jgi:hypothetical protein